MYDIEGACKEKHLRTSLRVRDAFTVSYRRDEGQIEILLELGSRGPESEKVLRTMLIAGRLEKNRHFEDQEDCRHYCGPCSPSCWATSTYPVLGAGAVQGVTYQVVLGAGAVQGVTYQVVLGAGAVQGVTHPVVLGAGAVQGVRSTYPVVLGAGAVQGVRSTYPVVLGAGAVQGVRERIVGERGRLADVLHLPCAAVLPQDVHVPRGLAPVVHLPVHLNVCGG